MKRRIKSLLKLIGITLILMALIVLVVDRTEARNGIDWHQSGAVINVDQQTDDVPTKNEVRNLLDENKDYLGLQEPPGPWREVIVLNPEPIERFYKGKVDTLQYRDTAYDTCFVGRQAYNRSYESGSPQEFAWFQHMAEFKDGSRRVLKEVMGRNQVVQHEKRCPKGVLFAETF